MSFPSYATALAYWFGRVNYEQRSPQPGDLKLDRMRALLRALGDPQDRPRVIHVAGSKGKGSTAAMFAAVCQAAGYRTGLFTSPHLTRVEERFQVDGVCVREAELLALLEDVAAASANLEPTFFEIATALGFLHFARRRVEVAVLEVGLGGRFDSTNVCRPALSVITSISFDHTQFLGDRLALIAREKAGIIKPGRPVVSGVLAPEAWPVIEEVAHARRAPLRQLGRDFHFRHEPGHIDADGATPDQVALTGVRHTWPRCPLGLRGAHQAANAALVGAGVEWLRERGWHLPDAALRTGLADVVWPARLEVVRRRPLVVLDCAHNVASAEAVVRTLAASFPTGGRRHLLFAGSGDKDVPSILAVLAPHFQQAVLTRFTANPRAVPPERLAEHWQRAGGGEFALAATPAEAWVLTRTAAAPDDLVCATGSVFLAGELRPLLLADVEEGRPTQRPPS